MFERPRSGERAVLVRLGFGAAVDPEDLRELEQLARSAGAQPVATVIGRRERPDPRFFMGSGKADEVRAAAAVSDTARSVNLQAIVGGDDEADLAARRSQPIQARLGVHVEFIAEKGPSPAKGGAGGIEGLAEARPVEVGYDTEHERPGLPIVASLAAAEESALAVSNPAGK